MKLFIIKLFGSVTVLLFFALQSISANEAGNESKKEEAAEVKLKIAIFPFEDIVDKKANRKLQKSITVRTHKHLSELLQYEVIAIKKSESLLRKNRIRPADLTRAKAKNFAVKLKADIFVTGTFVAANKKLQINAEAVNVTSGQVAASAQVNGLLGKFNNETIDDLGLKLSNRLVGEQKPEPKIAPEPEAETDPVDHRDQVFLVLGATAGAGNLGTFELGVFNNFFFVGLGGGAFRQSNNDKEYIQPVLTVKAGLVFAMNESIGIGAEAMLAAYQARDHDEFSHHVYSLAFGPRFWFAERSFEIFPFYSPQFAEAAEIVDHKAGLSIRFFLSFKQGFGGDNDLSPNTNKRVLDEI